MQFGDGDMYTDPFGWAGSKGVVPLDNRLYGYSCGGKIQFSNSIETLEWLLLTFISRTCSTNPSCS